MDDLKPIPEGNLRTGYTTGACATACTKAALLSLLMQRPIQFVEIELPIGEKVVFQIASCTYTADHATCTTIKDAGDDPDVTHGAEIGCTVTLNAEGKVVFVRGDGVGVVTLPGLSIPVGQPAINPVPRKMMLGEVEMLVKEHGIHKGINVEVFVVNGKELAKKTLNARVGIIDGLSILGTTGIVKPYSASSFIASITQGIDVAVANGCQEIVINSGGRSEKLLRDNFSYLPEFAFVQYGNWIGETLGKIKEGPLKKVTLGIMLGKAVKLAQGELNTHSGQSSWDKNFIAKLAEEAGYSELKAQEILNLSMARRLVEIFEFKVDEPFFQMLGFYCYKTCRAIVPHVDLEVFLIDANDRIIQFNKRI